jgi:hypothetical protein
MCALRVSHVAGSFGFTAVAVITDLIPCFRSRKNTTNLFESSLGVRYPKLL